MNTDAPLPTDEKLIADLDNLHALCAFAYEQGFHELGYDPVASVAAVIERLQETLTYTTLTPNAPAEQFKAVLDAAEKGEFVNGQDLITALWWRVRNQRTELRRKNQEVERLRTALGSLLPGLVLDLRYANDDDDKDAMQSRIETVQEALNRLPPAVEPEFPVPPEEAYDISRWKS